ncbi:MAG: AAA family ATPase, partial [Bacteroidetes bacterium]|nr:AAA family ATPase [Bacteroidota bacterium]
MHFRTLSLQCKESKEVIDLTKQVSFFHGKIGSGKSSIARLINFALGGNLEKTSAIQSEAISV